MANGRILRAVVAGLLAGLALAVSAAVSSPAAAARRGEDLAFTVERVVVDEGDGMVRLPIRRPAAQALDATEAGFTAIAIDAVEGRDYTPTSGRVRLEVGDTVAEVVVGLLDDDLPTREQRTFLVRLHDVDHRDRSIDEATVVIRDDDRVPAVAPQAALPTPVPAPRTAAAPTPNDAPTAEAMTGTRRVVRKRIVTTSPVTPAPSAAPETRITRLRIEQAGDPLAQVPFPERPSSYLALSLLAALALSQVLLALWRHLHAIA